MPIKPENVARYPADWPDIRARIQQRAGDKCEECGVQNRAWGYRENGAFHPVNKPQVIEMVKSGREWVQPPFDFGPHRVIEIVCTVSHTDHTPENCADGNLRFLCQRCHLAHDAVHHAQTRYQTRREGLAISDLFDNEFVSAEKHR